MTQQEHYEDLMRDSTLYCCYCGTEKHSLSCCGENHFMTFSEMDKEWQDDFLDSLE
jgi:hypothetical protein